MAIELFVENLDSVPEALREEYMEAEGGYRLKAAEGYIAKSDVEDVSGLKSALHKEREAARESARKLRQMQEQTAGFDMDEYNALKDAQAKAEEDRAKKAGEWDNLKNQLVTKHQDEVAKLKDEKAALMKSFSKQLSETAALQAISENKGNLMLLKPHVLAAIKMEQDEAGAFHTRVVDDAGNARMGSDGKFLTVSDYVREMRENETFAGAFIGSGSSGGGTPPGAGQGQGNGGKGGIPSDLKRGNMTPRDKVDFIKEHGEAEFLKLPA